MGPRKAAAQRGPRGQARQQGAGKQGLGRGQEAKEVAGCWGWNGGRAEVGAGAAEWKGGRCWGAGWVRGRQWGGVRGGSPPAPTQLGWAHGLRSASGSPRGTLFQAAVYASLCAARAVAWWGRGRSAGTDMEESARSPTRRVKVAQRAHISRGTDSNASNHPRAPPPSRAEGTCK